MKQEKLKNYNAWLSFVSHKNAEKLILIYSSLFTDSQGQNEIWSLS